MVISVVCIEKVSERPTPDVPRSGLHVVFVLLSDMQSHIAIWTTITPLKSLLLTIYYPRTYFPSLKYFMFSTRHMYYPPNCLISLARRPD